MAAQEITLRFKGDPSQLKGVLSDVRSSYGRTVTEIVSLSKDVTSQMNAMWTQRGKEVSAALAKELDTERAYASQEVQSATRTQREIVATYRQRERDGAAIARSEAAAWAQHEAEKVAASRRAEKQGEAIVAESGRAKERSAKQSEEARRQATRVALTDIARLERERVQIVTQNERTIAALAKTTADTRVREGRRASNAMLASLREEAREVERIQRAQAAPTRGGGSAFLSGAAGGLTALVGVSVVSEIRQAGAAWLDYASKLETTKIAFTTMLGSAELAQQHLNELQQFALKTPFQFSELIDASQRMQALGFSAQQVVPLLTDVGNAVAAAGGGSERLDRVVLAISQIQSKGKVATQELNQLAESGISGFKILELQTGKTRAELVKMVEAGEISSAVFLEAFQKFSQQNFGGLMEQQSKTFTGAMSNIKDALLQTASTAFQPLYDRLNQLAKQMADTSTKSKKFQEDMNAVGKEVAQTWDGAIEAIHLFRDAYSLVRAAVIQQVELTRHGFLSLVASITSVVFAMEAMARFAAGDWAGAVGALRRSNDAVTLSLLEMQKTVHSAGGGWRELMDIMGRAEARFKSTADSVIAARAALIAAETATNIQGGSIGVSAGILREKQPETEDTRQAKADARRNVELQAEKRIADLQLQTVLNNIQAEEDALDRSFKNREVNFAHYVARSEVLEAQRHQQIIGGLKEEAEAAEGLRDANARRVADEEILARLTQENNRHTREKNKLTDESLRLQKELAAFIADQEEAILKLDIGEKSHLRVAQDLIRNLEEQGEVLPEITQFWLQLRAAILDAAAAQERLNETLEQHRQAVIDSVSGEVEGVKNPISPEELETLGPPPKPPAEWTLWEQMIISIQERMQGFSDFVHGTLIGAFHAMTEAVGHSIAAWALYGESLGKALRKALAQILAQIAAEAAIQALLHAAYAIGRAAFGDFSGAAQHALAAAKFGAIAVAAGVGARLVAGQAFQSASGGGGGSSSSGGSTGGTASNRPSEPQALEVDRRTSAPQVITNVIEYRIKGGVIADEFAQDYLLNGRTRIIIKSDGQG